jgi:hypothetical protein
MFFQITGAKWYVLKILGQSQYWLTYCFPLISFILFYNNQMLSYHGIKTLILIDMFE